MLCHFHLTGIDEAFTTASSIISKPLKAKEDNTSILSPNSTQMIPGNWNATHLNEYKYWFVSRAIEIVGDRIKINFLQELTHNFDRFGSKEEIETIPKLCIFYKSNEKPRPVSPSRTVS